VSVSSFLSSVVWVYTMMIIAWIVIGMLDLPYNRTLVTVREFLDSICRPYVGFFRRYVPPIGPLDLSPMVAIIVLQVGRQLVAVFLNV
jgi:YggT family protein